MNNAMKAIIKKDLRGITANRQLFLTILIVPLVLTIVLPSIFILVFYFMPDESADLQRLFELLPVAERTGDLGQIFIKLVLNNIMPVFFLIIPIMASSIMAASSFVGEKEKHTLETLLYCPLSLKQIFRSKVLASFLLSMAVSFLSFFVMVLVLETEILLTTGSFLSPDMSWLVIMLLISPSISLIAITLIVRGSAKAQTMEEAQQGAVYLVVPVVLLIVGQFTGILLVGTWLLLGLGIVLTFFAWLLIRSSMSRFGYEVLLR